MLVFSSVGLNWRDHVEYNPGLKRPADIDISIANPEKAEKKLKWQASYFMRDVARMMVEAEQIRIQKQ